MDEYQRVLCFRCWIIPGKHSYSWDLQHTSHIPCFWTNWTTQLEPTRLFLQKTYCCFIAGLLLIARSVILLESWTRAQDLLENCHFTIILPFNLSFPIKIKHKSPRNLSPVPLGLSALLKWTPRVIRVRGETPNTPEGSSFNLSHALSPNDF